MRYGFLAAGLVFAALALPSQAGAEDAPPPPKESITVTDHVFLDNPDGKGDPNAISCRKPQQLPRSRLMAPPVCKRNGEWAQIRKDGNDVSPDGREIIPSEKGRTLRPQICLPAPPSSSTSNMGAYSFNPVCN